MQSSYARQVTARVLVVEDDETVGEVVVSYLRNAGYDVSRARDGVSALRMAGESTPDLVVLDLMLPGMNGLEVCRRLRSIGPHAGDTPVIMLTALGAENDRLLGLEMGADDYLTKPFSPRELVLRVRSVLRRSVGPAEAGGSAVAGRPPVLRDGDLSIDLNAHQAVRAGRVLMLTGREFDLLAFLVDNPGQAFSRAQLLERVWGWSFGDHSTVTVHVRRLREKVEADPAAPVRLVTVWGVGYRWDPAEILDVA